MPGDVQRSGPKELINPKDADALFELIIFKDRLNCGLGVSDIISKIQQIEPNISFKQAENYDTIRKFLLLQRDKREIAKTGFTLLTKAIYLNNIWIFIIFICVHVFIYTRLQRVT